MHSEPTDIYQDLIRMSKHPIKVACRELHDDWITIPPHIDGQIKCASFDKEAEHILCIIHMRYWNEDKTGIYVPFIYKGYHIFFTKDLEL